MTDGSRPTEADFDAAISELWKNGKISEEAQMLRAALSVAFDNPAYAQWLGDFLPDYVWKLIDVAIQRGLNARIPRLAVLEKQIEALKPNKKDT